MKVKSVCERRLPLCSRVYWREAWEPSLRSANNVQILTGNKKS